MKTTQWMHAAVLTIGIGGCGGSLGKPEDLARTVGVSYVEEEDEILSTCAAIERAQMPKSATPAAGAQDANASEKALALEKHLRADLRGRASALLEVAGVSAVAETELDALLDCPDPQSCAKVAESLATKAQIAPAGDVAKVLEASLGAGLTPAALMTNLRVLAANFQFAQATVLGLIQVAQLVEGMVDDVSDSVGYFKAFASPLLKRVSAELIAVGMDAVLRELEKKNLVSAGSVAVEACHAYKRIDPSAQVTGRVLRRAILRFSVGSYAKSSGMEAACKELSEQKGGDAVCEEILEEQLGLDEAQATEAFAAAVDPTPPAELLASLPTKVSTEHLKAFRDASTMCVQSADDPGACGLDRVATVASMLAELRKENNGRADGFSAIEARVVSLEGSYANLASRFEALEHRYDELSGSYRSMAQSDQEMWKTYREALDKGGAEGLPKQLRDVESRISAQLPKKTNAPRCADYVRKVMTERTTFAREQLGVSFGGCAGSWDTAKSLSAVYPTKFTGVTVSHDELCEQRFVTIRADIPFPESSPKLPVDAIWRCPSKGCIDQGFRTLLGGIAAKNPSHLVFIGSTDAMPITNKKPILAAWDTKKGEYGSDPLAGLVSSPPTDDELQRILSMLRVYSVTEEIDPTKKVAFIRDAAGKAGQARRVQVRFADPALTMDLATGCTN
ncbi:MAG: hypothetical protein HOW73_34135 [Polyangiaceae bacterium]|nr:hypothetical protein [Polyangiaceae bacterium]